MYRENDNFIDQSRKEANDVKACFTTFSFQAIAFSVVLLGAIITFQPDQPYIGFAVLLVIIVVLSVCRIGNYKFGTSNRHFGFELFLDFFMKKKYEVRLIHKDIDWEGLLRAWRVVQPTIFDEIYYTKLNTKWWAIRKRWNYNKIRMELLEKTYKHKFKNIKWADYIFPIDHIIKYFVLKKFREENRWWFDPYSLVKSEKLSDYNVLWYPGSYLHTMQRILELIGIVALVPVLVVPLQFQYHEDYKNIFFYHTFGDIREFSVFAAIITIFSIIGVIVSIRHINSRRKLLESGLLSIHSCAVIWQIVCIAHIRALYNSGNDQNMYLRNLSGEAKDIREYAFNIYNWIANG